LTRRERLDSVRMILLSLDDADLLAIERSWPTIRLVVRQFEDRRTSLGLHDLDSEALIAATLDELGGDLDALLGDAGGLQP
jgi:hypothetical protein